MKILRNKSVLMDNIIAIIRWVYEVFALEDMAFMCRNIES